MVEDGNHHKQDGNQLTKDGEGDLTIGAGRNVNVGYLRDVGERNPSFVSCSNTVTMPTTTIITTTASHAIQAAAGGTQVVTSTLTRTSTTIVTEGDYGTTPAKQLLPADSKCKKPEEEKEESVNKRVHLEKENYVVGTAIMTQILDELKNVKTVMTQIQSENQDWKSKVTAIESDMKDVKESVNMAHNLINDEMKNREKIQKDLKSELMEQARELTNNAQLLVKQSGEIKSLKDDVTHTRQQLKSIAEEQVKLKSPLCELNNRINSVTEPVEFPIKTTLVAQNIWYSEEEDMLQKSRTLTHSTLNLPQIRIVRAVHKSGWKSGAGLVKIELGSEQDLETVLGRKWELKNSTIPEIKDIFLRQSKKEEVLLMEKNLDLVMRDLGVRDDYVRVKSGNLVRKDRLSYRGRGYAPRGSRGHGGPQGCGRGSPTK